MRTGGPEDDEGSAKVQLRRSRVQKCKGGRGEAARGHEGEREDSRAGGHVGWRAGK